MLSHGYFHIFLLPGQKRGSLLMIPSSQLFNFDKCSRRIKLKYCARKKLKYCARKWLSLNILISTLRLKIYEYNSVGWIWFMIYGNRECGLYCFTQHTTRLPWKICNLAVCLDENKTLQLICRLYMILLLDPIGML